MTIVVMFGLFDRLNLSGVYTCPGKARATCFNGQNGDLFWIIEDKKYDLCIDLPNGFPCNPGLLAVLLHNGSAKIHADQLQWLEKKSQSNTCRVGSFSHPDKGLIADTIRKWANNMPNESDVSAETEKYGRIVGLNVLDELAAWHLLVMATNDSNNNYIKMRDEVLGRGNAFVGDLELEANVDKNDWLNVLQERTIKFC